MRRARGFTLVELMVALAVIGLAGAAVALTLPRSAHPRPAKPVVDNEPPGTRKSMTTKGT